MMDFKKRFKKANTRSVNIESPRNIAVRVYSYDTTSSNIADHSATGLDLRTKSMVTVHLRSLDNPLTSGHNRPEIRDIANAKERKTHVVADPKGEKSGVIIFQDCRKVGESTFTSNWANAAIHNGESALEGIETGYTTIVLAPDKFDPRNPSKELRNTAFTRQAKLSAAQVFGNAQVEEMKAFMLRCLTCSDGNGKYRPEFILRYVDRSGPQMDVDSAIFTSTLTKMPDETYVVSDAAASLETFFTQTQDSAGNDNTRPHFSALQELVAYMTNTPSVGVDTFAVEIIPVARRNFGTTKRKDFFAIRNYTKPTGLLSKNERSDKGESYFARFHKPTENKRPIKLWIPAYATTLCATEEVMNKGIPQISLVDYRFVKDVMTLDVFPAGYEQTYLPTKNFNFPEMLIQRYASDSFATPTSGDSPQQAGENQSINAGEHQPALGVQSAAPLTQSIPAPNSKMSPIDDQLMHELDRLINV